MCNLLDVKLEDNLANWLDLHTKVFNHGRRHIRTEDGKDMVDSEPNPT